MKLYVGNLSFETSGTDLEKAFANYGDVSSAKVVTDRETGRSRGFGFVEMRKREDGEAAIKGLNLEEINGRSITVNEAKPPREKTQRW